MTGTRQSTPRPAPSTGPGRGEEPDPARLAAYSVLVERERDASPPADRILDRALSRDRRMSPRDREFATNLVYTTIRHLATIDEAIRAGGGREPAELDVRTRTIVRLGVCQILYSRSVPRYAAVASSVDLARKAGKAPACGLVNALLRNIVRARETGGGPAPVDDTTPEGLALATSHPLWLVTRLTGAFGLECAKRFLEYDNEPAPLALRVNLGKTTRDRALERLRVAGFEARASEWLPEGILLAATAYPPDLPGFDLGWLVVQDEAAQIVSHLVAPRGGDTILDLCAGLGGKALHLAARLRAAGGGRVVAADPSPGKLRRLREMAGRLGASNVRILANDGRGAGGALRANFFDHVLVDAPCSDLGSLRRHPDVKWRRREEDIERLSGLQGELLAAAAGLARPGGAIVYCTCTVTEEENDRVVRRFLDTHEGFSIDDPRPDLPEPCRKLVGDDLVLRTYPVVGQMDGFFSVRLRKQKKEEGNA